MPIRRSGVLKQAFDTKLEADVFVQWIHSHGGDEECGLPHGLQIERSDDDQWLVPYTRAIGNNRPDGVAEGIRAALTRIRFELGDEKRIASAAFRV